MSNCCDISNPLIRDGVSQRQRQTPALSPDYVKIDDRTLADFLVFVFRLAQQVDYYEARELPPESDRPGPNQRSGDWRALFVNSTPVWIALISKTPGQALSQTYKQQLATLSATLHSLTTDKPLSSLAQNNLQSILQTWAELLSHLRLWHETLESYTPLKSILRGLVKTNLTAPLDRMQGFDRAYELATGIAAVSPDFYATFAARFGLSRSPDENFYRSFATAFGLPLGPPVADATPLMGSALQVRTELNEVFQVLFQNFHQIIQLAPQYQVHSLEAQRNHQPHIAMFIGFWEVLKPAQQDLNRMTQRHLDFFYRQVLQLPERPAEPDHVHLLFELAKFQAEFALKADIQFKAGKDATGMELFYQLDQDIVLDKAQITSLKSIFLDSTERSAPGGGLPKTLTGLYASPIVNSFDGSGGEFPKDQAVKAWRPFASFDRVGNRFLNPADIGIAIADSIFFLQEGDRAVTFSFALNNFNTDAQTAADKLADLFQVHFSGEKAWLPATVKSSSFAEGQLTLQVDLPAGSAPVVPFHADLTEPALPLDTSLPVALLRLKPDERLDGKAPYHFFQSAKLTQIGLEVAVNKVRNLVLQNDLSVLDATKPFQPFGPLPKIGSNLYIGSQEIFQKRLTSLKLNLTFETPAPNWGEHYAAYGANPNPGNLKVQSLRSGTWQPTSTPPTKNLFTATTYTFTKDQLSSLKLNQPETTEPIEAWNHQSKNGFLRLQLTGTDFLHNKFSQVLSRQVLAQAMLAADPPRAVVGAYYEVPSSTNEDAATTEAATSSNLANAFTRGLNAAEQAQVKPSIANEPYTPVIQSLSLDYEAITTLNPGNAAPTSDSRIYHLHPFERYARRDQTTTPYFLPHFDQEGELLIGVANLQPLTLLNLLVQVAEETADTSLKTIDVQWSYLVDNTWKPFEDYQIVSDGTEQLISSGIIQLAIPADISKQYTTILDPALHWLKVGVPQRSGAIPFIIGVHAQAARATFVDAENDPNHLATPLPAGAIAKLVEPLAEVKKIQQPYLSFGGRPKEQAPSYYIRVSEHLRHKGRAVTIFDYERLVLEHFPEIYKVRCINHGQVVSDRLRELVPGAVTLAAIPDLSQRHTTNDLQPKVNINLLKQIEADLRQHCSPWVEIQVVNPRYEEIQVDFEVKFKSPYDGNFDYYKRELETAIVGFLSPWTASEGADIHFGGKVYRSAILNFVEEQPTVDYVLNFQMNQGDQKDIREFVAPTARSILVSVVPSTATPPGPGHLIRPATNCPLSPSLTTDTLGYPPLNQIQITAAES